MAAVSFMKSASNAASATVGNYKTPKERQLILFKDTRGSTGVDDYKLRKHEKAKKAAEKGVGKEGTFDMSFIEKEKTSYTMEENFNAYRLFCLMDVDNSGFISLRELRRVLTGHSANNALIAEFPHPDVGIVWNLDQDDCVCIENIEDKSPASLNRELINGLILMRINEVIIPPYERYSLQVLQNELIRIHDQPVELEFVEPLFIINKFTTSLDIEVYGVIYTAWLPVGAVNNFSTMEKNIRNALIEAHPALAVVNIRIDRKSKRVTLSCDEYPFRLMFATGPNFQVSCRYCLGFTALDYEESFEHVGEVLVVDLDLKLPDDKIDILMEELFGTFDRDGSGEFQFEEFRDFYTKLLANDQCLQTLRDYAHYRFRNKLIEKRRNEIFEQRKQKARRRKLLKEKEGQLMAAQRQKRLDNQVLCYDGVVRKKIEHRREDQIMIKVEKGATKPPAHPSIEIDTPIEDAEKISRMLTRQQTRKIRKEQELQRKEKLLDVMKTNMETEKSLKRSQQDVQQRGNKLHMSEMLQVLKGAYMRGFNTFETGVHGIQALSLNQNVVLSPGLKIGMNLFTNLASVDDIDIEDVDNKRMHPSALRYFFMRERMGDKFDASKRHPCFFGADYSRDDSRHSSMGLGVCRAILSQRTSHKVSQSLQSQFDLPVDYIKEDVRDLLNEMTDLLEASSELAKNFVSHLFLPPETEESVEFLDQQSVSTRSSVGLFKSDMSSSQSTQSVVEIEHAEQLREEGNKSPACSENDSVSEKLERDHSVQKSSHSLLTSDSDSQSNSSEDSDSDNDIINELPIIPDINSYLYEKCKRSLSDDIEFTKSRQQSLEDCEIFSSEEIIHHLARSSMDTIVDVVTKNLSKLICSHQSNLIKPTTSPILRQTSSFRKREGIMYKRATFEGSGRLLISGGESGNYTIETDTDTFNLAKADTKVIGLCIYDVLILHRERVLETAEDNDRRKQLLNLSKCTLSVSVTYNHTEKILYYPSDDNFNEVKKSKVSRRKYQLSGSEIRFDKIRWIRDCIWSKLYLKDEKWKNIEIRNYQKITFQFFNQSSSGKQTLLGEILISFQDLLIAYEKQLNQKRKIEGKSFRFSSAAPFVYSVPLTFTSSAHSLPIQCDVSLNIDTNLTCDYNRIQRKSSEYWNRKRPQHWTVYPNFPINTGVVRQKYRDIARQYDKQEIIHPSVVGFCIRYKGHPQDEVNFIHPMFTDFSLVKKPLPRIILDEIRRQAQLGNKTNPFKYKPMKECPICYDHQPGCPRCFNMPALPNGDPMRPIDFQFDPDLEQREKAERELKALKKEQAAKMKSDARRALLAAGRSFIEDEDEESVQSSVSLIKVTSDRPKIHTRLTTERGLQLYRNIMLRILTVYVKVMPGHDVIRVQIDPDDTIWHLHNMFKAHHPLGNRRGSMLILPTSVGLFHMDADMIPENEFMKARRTALIKVADYGLVRRNSSIVTIFVPYYKDDTLIPIMKKYIKENLIGEGLNFDIPNITHNKTIPESLESDPIQSSLLQVVIRNYHDQQIHLKAKYQIMGRKHQEHLKKLADERQKALVARRLEEDRLRIQEEKEISKKLKGLTGDELLEAKEEIFKQRQTRIMESGTVAEKRAVERALKAADRHLKLEEKRLTRITMMKTQFPQIEIHDDSTESSTSQPGQLQFLMSSSSTPQLPSIAENTSHQSSSAAKPHEPSSAGEKRSQVQQQDEMPERENSKHEDEDNISWGVPMVMEMETGRTKDIEQLSKEVDITVAKQTSKDSSTHQASNSKTKKKKKGSHEQEGIYDKNEKILLPSAMVDAPLSSISGASSLSSPSQYQVPDNSPNSSQLPPIRNRLKEITGFFSFAKK